MNLTEKEYNELLIDIINLNNKINNLNKTLNNKELELNKINLKLNDLKEKNNKLNDENNNLKEYKYKYYDECLYNIKNINELLFIDNYNEEDNIKQFKKKYKDKIKNKILETKNNIYEKYNITIDNLSDIFLYLFFSFDILKLLNNDNNINKFIDEYKREFSYIYYTDYNHFNTLDNTIEELYKYYKITSKDINNEVLKEYIRINILNNILKYTENHKNITKYLEYKKILFLNIDKIMEYSEDYKILKLRNNLLNDILQYLNKQNIKDKFNVNYLEDININEIIDNYIKQLKELFKPKKPKK